MPIVKNDPMPTQGAVGGRFHVRSPRACSRPIGYFREPMQFDTTRSPLGELIYQLKYRGPDSNSLYRSSSANWNRSGHHRQTPYAEVARKGTAVPETPHAPDPHMVE